MIPPHSQLVSTSSPVEACGVKISLKPSARRRLFSQESFNTPFPFRLILPALTHKVIKDFPNLLLLRRRRRLWVERTRRSHFHFCSRTYFNLISPKIARNRKCLVGGCLVFIIGRLCACKRDGRVQKKKDNRTSGTIPRKRTSTTFLHNKPIPLTGVSPIRRSDGVNCEN